MVLSTFIFLALLLTTVLGNYNLVIGDCNLLPEERTKVFCQGDTTGKCWNTLALKYVNILRACAKAKLGTSIEPLKPGTLYMLQNALLHSRNQASARSLWHQNLGATSFGTGVCRLVGLNGENVAFHTWQINPAWYCVMSQWLNSPGHRANMLRTWFKEMVVGVVVESTGRRYCTQTFINRYSNQECQTSIDDTFTAYSEYRVPLDNKTVVLKKECSIKPNQYFPQVVICTCEENSICYHLEKVDAYCKLYKTCTQL